MPLPIPHKRAAVAFVLLTLLTGAMALSGCGGGKDEVGEKPVSGPTARPETPPVAPAALSALGFMPKGAQVAIGIPPVNGVLAKVKTFSERYGTPEFDPQAALDEWVAELAAEVGTPGAATLGEVASGKGVNADAPMAAFLDFSPAIEAAAAEQRRRSMSRSGVASDVMTGSEGDSAMEDASPPEVVEIPDPEPRWVGVVEFSDSEKAKATIQQVALDSRSIPDEPTESIAVGDVEITVYDPDELAYFVSDKFVVFGADLDLLKEAAARVAEPADLQYGTKGFPAEADDELVVLVYPSAYVKLVKTAAASVAESTGAESPVAKVAMSQAEALESMFGADGAHSPIAVSLVWEERALRLHGRVDCEAYPGVQDAVGPPAPLRLTSALPDETLAFLGLGVTDEEKALLLDVAIPSVTQSLKENPAAAMVLTWGNQIIEMLKDEISVGITRMEYDFPSIYAMVGLADVDKAKFLLSMFVPSTDVETYREAKILQATGQMPVPVYYALASSALLASNDVDGLKAVIDRLLDGKSSGLLDSIRGFASRSPYYAAFYVDDTVYSDVVAPTADLTGAANPDLEQTGKQVTDVIDAIRMTKGVEGKWLSTRFEIDLKAPASDI